MRLSELIAAYGDDRVTFQNLDQCATDLNMGKRGTKITFVTEERLGLDGPEKLGLVVWLDRQRVADIVAGRTTTAPPVGTEAEGRSEPSKSAPQPTTGDE